MPTGGQVTQLLRAYGRGDRDAFDQLVPMLYEDLRRLARGRIRSRGGGQTLDTTGLVHEVWLRFVDQQGLSLNDRGHFLAVAARAMSQVVIGFARKHGAAKRGGGVRPVTLDEAEIAFEGQVEQLLALDQALAGLAEHDPRLARVVECRFFAGFSEEETAAAMDVSLRTAQRTWMRARAWLKEALGGASC